MVRRNRIRRGRAASARVTGWVVTLAVIALAPVVVIVGEPLRRYFLHGPKRWRRSGLARVIVTNRMLIALTTPGRWVMDRVSRLSSRRLVRPGGRGRGGGPPPAGVREPRRPKPTAPAAAIALAEPRPE